jgi:hypothetical protein
MRRLHVTLEDGSSTVIAAEIGPEVEPRRWLTNLAANELLFLDGGSDDDGLIVRRQITKFVEELGEAPEKDVPRVERRRRRALAITGAALLAFGPPAGQTALERAWATEPERAARARSEQAKDDDLARANLSPTTRLLGGFPKRTPDPETLLDFSDAVLGQDRNNGVAWMAKSIASQSLQRADDRKRANAELLRLARENALLPTRGASSASSKATRRTEFQEQLLELLPEVIRTDPAFGRDVRDVLLRSIDPQAGGRSVLAGPNRNRPRR